MTIAAERLTLEQKLDLIRSRARRLGFRRHDLEDAVQEVMLAILEFEYDPDKSNGATETTALTTVIDRRLKTLLRSQKRYAGLLSRATDQLAVACQGFDDGPYCEEAGGLERVASAELDEILSSMDEEMQEVCRLLMEGLSTTGIAEQLGMGWHRANRIVDTIRERLQAAGLNPTDVE
ncbi:MAG: sigma-70 family RNA polymerase sigma factor [Planctomycetaceae bacterium]|nr:sigma-70 family RNA polymerase sigma factor [Planctomycetaceae bacterium]